MSESARVLDVHEMAAFRAFLVKMAEGVRNGLATADHEVKDTKHWLDHVQPQVWARRIKKLERQFEDAQETLRRKRFSPTPTGEPPNVMVEQKMVRVVKERLEEARARAERTKQWARRFDREEQIFRGNTQGARTTVQNTVPQAIKTLDELLGHLDEYMKLRASVVEPETPAEPDRHESVARPEAETGPINDHVAQPEPDPREGGDA